ncbi:MAG: cyclic pyranopterin monophosphate synthase MoaC [Nitriliruptorales bacterium]
MSDSSSPSGGLSHLDDEGRARMVDVGAKDATERTARAACEVHVPAEVAEALVAGNLPKGDAIAVARIAGIQAAKRTADLIPLCHQIALSHVDVEIEVDASGRVDVSSTVRTVDRTGVEMEALVAVSVAALTIYDMVKAMARGARVTDVRLVEKTGGRRGDWRGD